ncbi:MAG: hypothetical protein J0H09_06560 [Burkholderiales bacterium]|nr:hypothetical protein [Burkholderiales bacterium]ODU70857.1 MAG: hypothetical protein ABT05_01330 [Lautropia sp. SCN 66-9]
MSEPSNATAIEGQKPKQQDKPLHPALRSLIWMLAEQAAEDSMRRIDQTPAESRPEAVNPPAPRIRRARKP